MKSVLDPKLIDYFFGRKFPMKVAEAALTGTPETEALVSDAIEATKGGEIHFGFQLVCYKDLGLAPLPWTVER